MDARTDAVKEVEQYKAHKEAGFKKFESLKPLEVR
jgi:hypothetical protein